MNLATVQGEFYEIFECGSRRAAPPAPGPSLHTEYWRPGPPSRTEPLQDQSAGGLERQTISLPD